MNLKTLNRYTCTQHVSPALRQQPGLWPEPLGGPDMANYKRGADRILPGATVEEKLLLNHRVDPDSGCWCWTGSVNVGGYGQIRFGGSPRPVHRVAYEIWVGPIPDGFTIDHVLARGCVHHNCINPAHLEAVTNRENIRRAARHNKYKTHCAQGHPYEGDNVIRKADGSRWCRTCKRAADRRQYLARKAAIR